MAEDRLAPLQIAADALEVDDAATADLGGGEGLGLDPAAHYVLGDLFQAQHLGEDRLRAEWSGAEIRDFLSGSGDGEPHYSRLFHRIPL